MAKESVSSSPEVQEFLPTENSTTPLQRALESLSVNLEDELMRYRQSRSKNGVAQSYSSQLKFRSKQRRRQRLNLIPVKAQGPSKLEAPPNPPSASSVSGNRPQPDIPLPETTPGDGMASPRTTAMPPVPPPNPRLQQPVPQGMPMVQTYQSQASTGGALQLRSGAIAPYQQLPDDYLESTEALLDSLPSPYDAPDNSYDDIDYTPTLREQLTTPLGIGALLLLLVGSAGFGYVVTSPKAVEFFQENGLIQTLRGGGEPASDPQVEEVEPIIDGPATGLQGIGPDLSEEEFQDLDLDRLSTIEQDDVTPVKPEAPFPGETAPSPPANNTVTAADDQGTTTDAAPPTSSAPVERPTAATTATGTTPTTITRPQIPATPQPAVAPQPQVRNVPPPSTVTPVPQVLPSPQTPPQPVQTPAPAASPTPPKPLATNQAPQSLPQSPTAPPAPLPQPGSSPDASAAPTAPAPITQPPPQSKSNYYVVTEYTGDQSLQSARNAVDGAYVRNFPNGAGIQMGAFSQESSARNMVQQLQNQGIPARVYSP